MARRRISASHRSRRHDHAHHPSTKDPGIPKAQIDAVLRPFVRVEQSRNRQTGGLGLGLTIARNIARGAGGEIRLSNEPAGGLRTELRLPLAA